MFGLNQAECCDGETADSGSIATAIIRLAGPGSLGPGEPAESTHSATG